MTKVVSAGVAEQIAAARIKQGLSQQELALRAGLHQSEVSRIERGISNSRCSTLEAIARALGSEVTIGEAPAKPRNGTAVTKFASTHKAAPALVERGKNWKISLGDAKELIQGLPSDSIDLIVTDPPYFIDGMGDDWNDATLKTKAGRAGTIGGLPVGMKFDRRQGLRLEAFMSPISHEFYRALKPGGFCISFAQARLYHRLAVAIEDAGFEVRDMLGWVHGGQAKAFSQDHFVRKMTNLSEAEKARIIKRLGGRKTPQLRPCLDPMVLAQKPKEGTFVENWLKYSTGLIDTGQSLDGKFPGNLMEVAKAKAEERGEENAHLTVKPVELIAHLIQIFSLPGQTILDPFMGSGSHGVAAITTGRQFIGFEIADNYFEVSRQRLQGEIPS